MSGYYVDNSMPLVWGDVLTGASRVPVDTMLASGSPPQSGGMVPGTLPAPSTHLGLTALAGGAKTGATQLGHGVNTVTTVASGADSVLLPYATPGAVVFVSNDGASALQIFGKGTDTIDGVATATGVALTNATRSWYIGTAGAGDGSNAGTWVSLKGLKST